MEIKYKHFVHQSIQQYMIYTLIHPIQLWYDSLISTTPLSSTTPLQNNIIYYASVQDESCPFNNKRLAVKVIIKNAPLKLTVTDFYFCSNVNQMSFVSTEH